MYSKFIGLFLMICLASCGNSPVFTKYRATTNGSWRKADTLEFRIEEIDSVARHDIFIMIRNDNTFPYSNLFLIAELNTPDNRVFRDTLEYEMATPDGRWLGKGQGSVFENKLWYKEDVVFSPPGVYTIEISQAMRKNGEVDGIDNLSGITDVGIEIARKEQ